MSKPLIEGAIYDAPRFLNSGETALVVEFGRSVEPEISDRVLSLDAAMTALKLPGVRETVPTYRSLMIHYDPLVIDRATLIAQVEEIASRPGTAGGPASRWVLPCCYDPEYGEDVGEIARMTGLSEEKVVSLHSGATFRVYMYGFAPGFCYLGGLPPELAVSRRTRPRPPHPPNMTLIGGGLAIVTTFSMPTGWWLMGRTPERMFSPQREKAFLVAVGDELKFEPVDRDTFLSLDARAAAGEVVARREALS
ncbi:allophanate hydrolase [Azorhizobium oxalatiphilum]|uniref:Allophanate hydrolase n=1 Tax=Azorhizobium oxalatiphilum TaxID=980631 RepID=A0A917FG42_9HYPH|nr:allophanate hydrolase subunit 1 [Azorhizobium oxalatiphilum]GGF78680.1 allophanate hydrolase [Azorhizobium oxalatiphilum]